jgi:hypothetical protein
MTAQVMAPLFCNFDPIDGTRQTVTSYYIDMRSKYHSKRSKGTGVDVHIREV